MIFCIIRIELRGPKLIATSNTAVANTIYLFMKAELCSYKISSHWGII